MEYMRERNHGVGFWGVREGVGRQGFLVMLLLLLLLERENAVWVICRLSRD